MQSEVELSTEVVVVFHLAGRPAVVKGLVNGKSPDKEKSLLGMESGMTKELVDHLGLG